MVCGKLNHEEWILYNSGILEDHSDLHCGLKKIQCRETLLAKFLCIFDKNFDVVDKVREATRECRSRFGQRDMTTSHL